MKKSKLLRLFSIVLCLVLAQTMILTKTIAAAENDKIQYIPVIVCVDTFLAQLNDGLITPPNTTKTIHYGCCNSDQYNVTPFWPWTECSNILGHSWSSWSFWNEVRRTHILLSNYCLVSLERWRFCQRTNCSAVQNETTTAWVVCCPPWGITATAEHGYGNTLQHIHMVNCVETILAYLNAGLITPLHTTIHYGCCDFDYYSNNNVITPFWPWTECSNILGHSWGVWGNWREVNSICHGGNCVIILERSRSCRRANCAVIQTERTLMRNIACCP